MKQWKIAVSSADAAPLTAPILMIGDVASNLRKAGALGYEAIEVHTREDVELDYEGIAKAAAESGCKVGMVITGRLNTEGKCDLISDIPYIAKAAVDGMKQYVDMAARLGAEGLVIGWVKGNVPAGGDRADDRRRDDRTDACDGDKYAHRHRVLLEYACGIGNRGAVHAGHTKPKADGAGQEWRKPRADKHNDQKGCNADAGNDQELRGRDLVRNHDAGRTAE